MIYDGGYVRVASWADGMKAASPASITKNTPYEKLRSIKFTQSGQDNTSGMSAALEGAVGPAMARLAKGGAGLMKASVPGTTNSPGVDTSCTLPTVRDRSGIPN